MRPDLFRAVILEVPFLDILTCLLDENMPLTLTDHLEFGNPITDKQIYELIASYSPYDNLSKKEFPAMFLTIQQGDPRVPYWSNLKFIEKLRDLAETPTKMPHFGYKNIKCRINKDGGHFGSTSNDVNLSANVQEFAWLEFLLLNPKSDQEQLLNLTILFNHSLIYFYSASHSAYRETLASIYTLLLSTH
jgi:oligopeptidase B